jgi:hypothetical protein
VNCALAETGDDALSTEHGALNCSVIRQHGDNSIAAASVDHLSGGMRAMLDERSHFAGRAIESGDLMTGFDEVGRHPGSHTTEPNKSNSHDFPSFLVCMMYVFFHRWISNLAA